MDDTMKVREPVVAGMFYERDPASLSNDIQGYLEDAEKDEDVYGIRGLVSPHAGYVYSGPTAGCGYKQLIGQRYETVIVLAPSHRAYFRGASVLDAEIYKTPLGGVKISPKVRELKGKGVFTYVEDAHTQEHSLEVQIPFLQKVLPPFKLVPIVVGDVNPFELADALEKHLDDDTLVVASTDLSHYKDYETCMNTDKVSVDAVVALDSEMMLRQGDACGMTGTVALMELAKRRGWRAKLFDYRNSGDTAGDKNQVVGYASVGFFEGLNRQEKETLLKIARKTVGEAVEGRTYEVDESTLSEKLKEKKAAFVTLNKNKRLRGCIGHLQPIMKLYMSVQENALNAAFEDPRFESLRKDEAEEIKIEISVLTAPKRLNHEGPDDLLAKLIPKVDGLIIKKGLRQSTYLPVVWEQLPDKEEFLANLCLKGGNPADSWKDPETEIYTYQAQEFHETGFK